MEHPPHTLSNQIQAGTDFSAAAAPALDGLQFQRAEIAPKHCVVCSAAITTEYFQLNGIDLCPACAAQWREGQQKPSLGAVSRGALFGFGAALAGAALMAVIAGVTGYQLALVAIAVGWMVGKMFRKGTRGYTSRRCQWLAVALTYFGISMSYVPDIIQMSREARAEQRAEKTSKGKAEAASASPDSNTKRTDGTAPAKPREPRVKALLGLAGDNPFVQLLLIAVLMVGGILLFPLLLIFTGISGIINAVIVFFGLQRAWRMMARDPRQLAGPLTYRLPGVETAAGAAPATI